MAKNAIERESAADIARRKSVDAKHIKDAAKEKLGVDKLADTPLTNAELAFCVSIEAKMNKGRRAEAPCAADILRYSRLKGRMEIKAEVEVDE